MSWRHSSDHEYRDALDLAAPRDAHATTDHHHAGRSGVKRPLTLRRRRGVVENDQYAAFARRVVAAYGRRVAAGDVEALAPMVQLAHDLDDAIGHAVAGLRGFGYSWGEIANRLGVTRQAVHQRWGNCAPATTPLSTTQSGGVPA